MQSAKTNQRWMGLFSIHPSSKSGPDQQRYLGCSRLGSLREAFLALSSCVPMLHCTIPQPRCIPLVLQYLTVLHDPHWLSIDLREQNPLFTGGRYLLTYSTDCMPVHIDNMRGDVRMACTLAGPSVCLLTDFTSILVTPLNWSVSGRYRFSIR